LNVDIYTTDQFHSFRLSIVVFFLYHTARC